jgi:hypothetical protein
MLLGYFLLFSEFTFLKSQSEINVVTDLQKKCSFFNPLTPELNPSAQRCLTKVFTGDFAS